MAESMKLVEILERTIARAEANSKAIAIIAKELETAAPGTTGRIATKLEAMGKTEASTPARVEELSRLARIITSP